MKKISIGQYYNADSFLHRMDPRVKLVLLVVYMVSIFAAKLPWGLVPVSAILALMVVGCRVPLKTIAGACGPIAFFVVLTFIANIALVRTGDVLFHLLWLPVTLDGVVGALLLGYRMFALMLAGAIFALVTSPVSITDGTERLLSPLERFGAPIHELAMMYTIAIRFVPILAGEMRHIMNAQVSRGAALDEGKFMQRAKVFVSMIVPLFASALRHSEELANAMEARCYVGGEGRTHYHVLKLRRQDYVAIGVFVTYLASLVVIAVAL
ncbi:MAG: energy-coupling factor transporter transmembrane component T [Coriobacteriales bacterium]|jgi:energy-coupling factor transport system permease protein